MVQESTLLTEIDEIMPGVVADRRWLHEHPELGFEETETATFVADRLRQLGVEDVRTGVGGNGVTGLIRGEKGPGKTVLIRADMDALPILEENDVEYVSQNPGVMHACGHDAHTSIQLGVARLLLDRKADFAGTVKLLFQPAEELPPGGAIEMIHDGALEDPHVDAVFGLHVAAEYEVGTIRYGAGAMSAFGDRFRITVQGKGGHGAYPHTAVDPVVVGSHVVVALQSIVSRNVDPTEPAVVSTTAFLSGEAFNVIPDTAELRGTVRTYDEEVRDAIRERIQTICNEIGAAMRAEITLEYMPGYPAMINDEAMTDLVRNAAINAIGEEKVIAGVPTMGGEDFAYFLRERPGSFFMVGTRNEERGIVWPHHHPRFDVDEEGFVSGLATMTNTVLTYLEST